MSVAERLVWQIERQLYDPLSISLLSERCAASPFHMARVFRTVTGLSPMTYVRARRLSEAAKRLASGKDDILTIALDAQFGSHEAFTRAFTRYFGVLPSSVRQARTIADLELMEPLKMKKDLIVNVAKPEIRERDGFRVIGMSKQASVETTSTIPPLWQAFAARYTELGDAINNPSYGVSWDGDENGNFRYLAGHEAGPDIAVPDGMQEILIPKARYAVFTHSGHISDIAKTIYTIWNKALPDEGLEPAETPDFELYDQRFDASTGRGTVEVWIPLK
ncbi:AraC family transcriptional regulator [Hoeflea poritis]|uniref:AraC family transcriptional regulator n=1 Tax=Hoeflea poritis TaxID=2993659 RepID=A0ABT4VUX1_9HYPH|nr:AraC family transcriptional regulator [Hoeflea poritis]MDA4848424.1 AraC family transcriptional regulator [Hoeflea poritis]